MAKESKFVMYIIKKFNMQKCYILRTDWGPKTKDHMYELCGHGLKQVPNNPYPRVIISHTIRWGSHSHKMETLHR